MIFVNFSMYDLIISMISSIVITVFTSLVLSISDYFVSDISAATASAEASALKSISVICS